MDYWSIALALAAILLALYYYCRSDTNIFEKDGIPFRKPLPLLGNSYGPLFKLESFAEMVEDMYNIHPTAKYVGMYDLMTPTLVLRDTELIKSVTVKNFENFPEHRQFLDETTEPLFGKNLFALRGDRWKEVRNLLTPAFTTSKMKGMFVLMSECGAEFASVLAALPPNERVHDLKDAFTRYTNDVIATCAFGIGINSMKDRKNLFYVYGREGTNFGTAMFLKFFLMRASPTLAKFLGLRLLNTKISTFFNDLIADTIKTRDEKGIVRPDMIQLMMEHRGKMELTNEDMTAQAFTFFFGGFDSTSTVMCFAAYEIGVNTDVQERLHEEIDKVLEENNGQLTYEAVNNMPYLDAVINETLRMYPVNVVTDRRCTKAFELPAALPEGKPHVLQPGAIIWIPIYGIQRDPEFFEEPNKFNPDRFIENGKSIVNSGAYVPFGLGPRMCIGNRFALLETKALLFHILARCDFVPCAKTPIPLKLDRKGLNMSAKNGFWMEIRPRSNPHPSLVTSVSNGSTKH